MGDAYSGLKVNFSESSDKAAIKKSEVGKYKYLWVDFLLYIHVMLK